MHLIRKVVLVLLFVVSIGMAQDIGGIFLGTNHYLPRNEHNFYNVSKTGTAFGFILPVNISKATIYFKMRGTYHSVDFKGYWGLYYQSLDMYEPQYMISASNEILVGKTFKTSPAISFVPQFGIGIIEEALLSEWPDGYNTAMVYMDLSLLTIYDYSFFDLGLMLNVEHDFLGDGDGFVSDMRMNVALVILK